MTTFSIISSSSLLWGATRTCYMLYSFPPSPWNKTRNNRRPAGTLPFSYSNWERKSLGYFREQSTQIGFFKNCWKQNSIRTIAIKKVSWTHAICELYYLSPVYLYVVRFLMESFNNFVFFSCWKNNKTPLAPFMGNNNNKGERNILDGDYWWRKFTMRKI